MPGSTGQAGWELAFLRNDRLLLTRQHHTAEPRWPKPTRLGNTARRLEHW